MNDHDSIPPDDDRPLVSLAGLGNPWMQPLRSWVIRQTRELRDIIPDEDAFWREPAWQIGGDLNWTGVLVTTKEQAARFDKVNDSLVAAGGQRIPCWGPAELEAYFGALLPQVDDAQRVRCIAAIQQQVTGAFLSGLQKGSGAA